MATFQVNEYDIDVNSKRLINATAGGYGLDDSAKPRLYFSEKVVWGLNCYDRNLSQASFASTDTWELYCDVDFDHDLYTGYLNAALTTAAATTAIVVNYATAPTTANPIPDTGGVLLRDDSGNRERVAYTAAANKYTTQVTYTCNQTLTYPYATGDYAAQEDPLMVSQDDSSFNVSGDWASLDAANGKISAKVDCTNWYFSLKVQAYLTANPTATEVPIWVQINKYVSGQTTPSVILQDVIYAKPSVRDIELAASVQGPVWTLPDARYLQVYANYSSATAALVDADRINVWDAGTSGVLKASVSQLNDYMGLTYLKLASQYSTATESLAATDVFNFFNTSTTSQEKLTARDVFGIEFAISDATTSRTLALTDRGACVYRSNASNNDTIIPTNASVAFATGARLDIVNEGAGACTLKAATTDVTLNGTAAGTGTISQWGRVHLSKRGTNTWVATGDYTT